MLKRRSMPETENLYYYDLHPETESLKDAALRGLSRPDKAMPPKFFYDAAGSVLFDAICATPEYYPTRTETALLRRHAGAIAATLGENCWLIEPGSGSSQKVRHLLDPLQPEAYQPLDISGDYLQQAAGELAREFPWLPVHAVCVDFSAGPLALPGLPSQREGRAVFFPGSSIGNFEPEDAVDFLGHLAEMLGPGGSLLIGVDLKKDEDVLHAAYNDAGGITAAFNRNLLARMNRELGADFALEEFAHAAFYNPGAGRIEMHLESRRDQDVRIDGQRFHFAEGERIHTENSYKYTVPEFQALAARAGFVPGEVWRDDSDWFSLQHLIVGEALCRS